MKKADVLKTLLPEEQRLVEPLVRKKVYFINWHHKEMLIQITHFHKAGIVFKPLSTVPGFNKVTQSGKIRYIYIKRHQFRAATIHDITCNMGTGTRFMTDYYGDTKNFLKNHGLELPQ